MNSFINMSILHRHRWKTHANSACFSIMCHLPWRSINMQILRQWLSHCDEFLFVCCLAARYGDVWAGVVPHADVFEPHADGRPVLPGVPQAVSVRRTELRRRGDIQSSQRPLPGVPLSPGPRSVQAQHVSTDAVQASAQRGLLSCVQRWVYTYSYPSITPHVFCCCSLFSNPDVSCLFVSLFVKFFPSLSSTLLSFLSFSDVALWRLRGH